MSVENNYAVILNPLTVVHPNGNHITDDSRCFYVNSFPYRNEAEKFIHSMESEVGMILISNHRLMGLDGNFLTEPHKLYREALFRRYSKEYFALNYVDDASNKHVLVLTDEFELLLILTEMMITHGNNPEAGAYTIEHFHQRGERRKIWERRWCDGEWVIAEMNLDDPQKASNFEQSKTINTLVGNVPDGTWAPLEHQRKISQSEWNELCDGIEDRDMHELRDGIADKLFTVYGMAARAGIDADADYQAMMVSQNSKFDTTEEDAIKTRQKYEELGIEVRQEQHQHPLTKVSVVVTYSAKEQLDHAGREIPEGKWLKSWRFKEPVYAPMAPLREAE